MGVVCRRLLLCCVVAQVAGSEGAQASGIRGLLPRSGVCSLDWAAAEADGRTVRSAQRPSSGGAGRRVPFSCGLVEVSVSLEVAQRVIRAMSEMAEYVPRLAVSERLGQQFSEVDVGGGSELGADPVQRYRQVLSLPFPVRDREYQIDVFEGRLDVSQEPSAVGQELWWSRWQLVPGSGNMLRNRGAWLGDEIGESRVRVLYLVDSDPGGGVPAWLVRRLGQPGLRDALASLAERMVEVDRLGRR